MVLQIIVALKPKGAYFKVTFHVTATIEMDISLEKVGHSYWVCIGAWATGVSRYTYREGFRLTRFQLSGGQCLRRKVVRLLY